MTRKEAIEILKENICKDCEYICSVGMEECDSDCCDNRDAINLLSENVVSEEVYTREYNLRKDAEMKVYKLERNIDDIKAEIKKIRSDNYMDYLIRHVCDKILKIIDEKK